MQTAALNIERFIASLEHAKENNLEDRAKTPNRRLHRLNIFYAG